MKLKYKDTGLVDVSFVSAFELRVNEKFDRVLCFTEGREPRFIY